MSYARAVSVLIVCPTCGSPSVRKVRRIRRLVGLECKICKHQWREIHDDGVVHGLVVLTGRR